MAKKLPFLLLIILVVLSSILFRANAQDSPAYLLGQYAKSKPDTSRVNLLIKLSSYYLLKPGEIRADLDSALMLAQQAKRLSNNLKYKSGEDEADFWIGRTYVEAKNYQAVTTLLKC